MWLVIQVFTAPTIQSLSCICWVGVGIFPTFCTAQLELLLPCTFQAVVLVNMVAGIRQLVLEGRTRELRLFARLKVSISWIIDFYGLLAEGTLAR